MVYHDGGAGQAMETLGAMLRRARLAQGLDLADMAERIKVNPNYLKALESDDLSGLPGGFFYKSFVRQYAAALGVDQRRVERALSDLPLQENETPAGREDESILKEIPPVESRAPAAPGLLIFNGLGPSIAVLVLVVLACGGFSAWWRRMQTIPLLDNSPREVSRLLPPDATPTPTPTPSDESPAVTPTPTPAAAPDSTTAPASASAPASAPAVATPPPAGGVRIVLTASQDSWVRVWTDGREVFSGTLKAQESKTFDGSTSARLRTGNASGLTVNWNGKPVQLPGTDAFVRDVSFTHDAVERTAKPAPAPDTEAEPAPTG